MSNFSANSVDRALSMLELLVNEPAGLPLSVIAQRLELPASATHRLLSVLTARRYVSQDPVSGIYSATLLLAAVGMRLLSSSHIGDVMQPILDEMAQATQELVRLSVLEGDHLVWVAKAQGAQSSIKYDPISGRDVPLHTTAMGKAWLASIGKDEAAAIIERRGLKGDLIGPRALSTMDSFMQELDITRANGFGLVEEEAEAGISAIAMVVRNGLGAGKPVVGCVAIAGPTYRLNRDRLVSFVPHLAAGCQRLSEVWPIRNYQGRSGSERVA